LMYRVLARPVFLTYKTDIDLDRPFFLHESLVNLL
jgi:hypothetical protein